MSLQYECGAGSFAAVRSADDGKQLEEGGAAGSTVKHSPEITDVGEVKTLVSGLPFAAFKKVSAPKLHTKERGNLPTNVHPIHYLARFGPSFSISLDRSHH